MSRKNFRWRVRREKEYRQGRYTAALERRAERQQNESSSMPRKVSTARGSCAEFDRVASARERAGGREANGDVLFCASVKRMTRCNRNRPE